MKKPVVIIPARAGSKRFVGKNPILWKYTENFLKESNLFGKCYVSTDSEDVGKKAEDAGFVVINRHNSLSGDTVPIKPVIQDVIAKYNLYDELICIMYLTYPGRKKQEFIDAIKYVSGNDTKSLLSFYESGDTPYLEKYYPDLDPVINHDLFRYQDYKKIINYTHYICMFYGEVLYSLDDQLFSKELTYPFIVNKKPVDVDYREQLEQWISD